MENQNQRINLNERIRNLESQLIAEKELTLSIQQAAQLRLETLSNRRVELYGLLKRMVVAYHLEAYIPIEHCPPPLSFPPFSSATSSCLKGEPNCPETSTLPSEDDSLSVSFTSDRMLSIASDHLLTTSASSPSSTVVSQDVSNLLQSPLKSNSESGVHMSSTFRLASDTAHAQQGVSSSQSEKRNNIKIRQSFRHRLRAATKTEAPPPHKGYRPHAESSPPIPHFPRLTTSVSSSMVYNNATESPREIHLKPLKVSESALPTSSSSESKRRSKSVFAGILRSSSFDTFSSLSPRDTSEFSSRISLEDAQVIDVLQMSFEFLDIHLNKSNTDAFVIPADGQAFRNFCQSISSDPLTTFLNATHNEISLVASLVKLVFSNIQQPLLTHESLTFEHWSSLLHIEDEYFQLLSVRSAINSLPKQHVETAQSFFTLCHRRCEEDNRAISNIAFGIGPVILRDLVSRQTAGVIRTVLADYYRVTELLIRKSDHIFSNQTLHYTLSPTGSVSTASFPATIDFLLDTIYCSVDTLFVDTVLLTHHYFTTSEELLTTFANVYAKLNSSAPWQQRLRRRIFWLLKKWLAEYISDLQQEPISFIAQLCNLLRLAQDIAQGTASSTTNAFSSSSSSSTSNQPLTTRCQEGVATTSMVPISDEIELDFSGDSTLDDPSVPFIRIYGVRLFESKKNRGSRLVRNISYFYQKKAISTILNDSPTLRNLLDTADSLSIAKSLTLIDSGLFKAIPSREFLKTAFQDEAKSPHFAAMATRFNLVGKWFAMNIVSWGDVHMRAADLAIAIDIAFHCFELRNFNTCFAILAGLNTAPVSRLKNTWEVLSKKTKKQYQRLSEIFEMSNNFNSYRSLYAVSAVPKVPYLMLFPKDLIAIEDNNPTLLHHNSTPFINFEKMNLLWGVFSDIRKTQQAVYPFPPKPELHVLLTQLKVPSDDELWARSLISEPREQV